MCSCDTCPSKEEVPRFTETVMHGEVSQSEQLALEGHGQAKYQVH